MELRGKNILITRASAQAEDLRAGLEKAGAHVLECPAIEIVPVDDWGAVDRAIANLHSYDWLVFTSANAVELFMRRVRAQGIACRVPIAAVGTATGARLSQWDLSPALVPRTFRSEALLDLFPVNLAGCRILIPRAETAREVLPEELRRRGAIVDVVPVYRTVKSSAGLENLRAIFANERVDAVVFTSPSAVRFFSEALGSGLTSALAAIPIAVIGPVAEEAVALAGLKASICPQRATIPDLIGAIREHFSRSGG
jgi:uroporphyrinogen III methyltransferase/synthase